MDCQKCGKESVYIKLDGGKQEYFCPNCKLYFAISVDLNDIEFENIEYDDSAGDYEGYSGY